MDISPEFTFSSNFSNKKKEITEDLSIKDLYKLQKDLRLIINTVESGEDFDGVFEFCGIQFFIHVMGFELSKKDKLIQLIFPEEHYWTAQYEIMSKEIIELRKRASVSCELVENFFCDFEYDLWKSYWTNESQIVYLKNLDFDQESWAYMEAKVRNLKTAKSEYGRILNDLEWQNVENQVINDRLKSKLKDLLIKEGELNFRTQEINSLADGLRATSKKLCQRQEKISVKKSSLKNKEKKLMKLQKKLLSNGSK